MSKPPVFRGAGSAEPPEGNFYKQLKAKPVLPDRMGAFAILRWQAVNNVELWSLHDETRAFAEGWCIGRRSWLDRSNGLRNGDWQSDRHSIGARGRTFVDDEQACQWVEGEAEIRGEHSIYRRALAVCALMTIRSAK